MRINTEKEHVSRGWLAQNGMRIVSEGSDEDGAFLIVEEEK